MRDKKIKKNRRKWPYIVVTAIMVPIIGIAGLLVYLLQLKAVPKNYWNRQETGGEIEKKYAALGEYEVESKEYDAGMENNKQKHFKVWYPEEEGKYPLVVMVNGTGVPYQKYEELFKHLASWGFVVIGNDYETSWDGVAASNSLDFALGTKEIASRIDEDKIAVGGHSQGGAGTVNAAAEFENSIQYKCAFTLSPTSTTLALHLKWCHNPDTEEAYAYDLSKLNIPMLMFAGTGEWDAGNEENPNGICPLLELTKNYDSLPQGIPAVMARRSDTEHGNMLWQSDPYVTAWLMYWLYDDAYAGEAFFGENPEMASNEYWQDFASK